MNKFLSGQRITAKEVMDHASCSECGSTFIVQSPRGGLVVDNVGRELTKCVVSYI